MRSREENLRLLKAAAAGKLRPEDLTNGGDPVFDICLDIDGAGKCKERWGLTEKQVERLKMRGQYFDVTLDLSKA